MSRRVLIVLGFLAICASLTWAAGTKESGGATTLTFMDGLYVQDSGEYKLLSSTVAKWMTANPQVALKKDEMSHDEYETKFRTLAAANGLTDFFYINGNQITPLSTAKMLYDMAPDLKTDSSWQKEQNPASMPEWVRGDAVYAMPQEMIITHLLFYNQAILRQVGVTSFPATWADFESLITKLAARPATHPSPSETKGNGCFGTRSSAPFPRV